MKGLRALVLTVALLAPAGAAGEGEYLIGGGDTLQVNVWKNPELSQSVIVRPDGKITLPLIRDVRAEGLTAMRLAEVLAEKLSAFVNAPNVTVTVSGPFNFRVYTQGAIANGVHSLPAPITARQLLAQAGGGTPEADLSRAAVLRGGKRLPLDLTVSSRSESSGADALLEPGDILAVPVREIILGRVLVVGAVAQPRALPFAEGMTLLDAYLGAGGGTDSADLKNVRVARLQASGETAEVPVDVEDLLVRGDLKKNIVLSPADILIVPSKSTQDRILVLGEVKSPRPIAFQEGMTLLDAYVQAGGGTEYADLDSVKIVRTEADGKRQELKVDVERLLKKADVSRNILLAPGDMVLVP